MSIHSQAHYREGTHQPLALSESPHLSWLSRQHPDVYFWLGDYPSLAFLRERTKIWRTVLVFCILTLGGKVPVLTTLAFYWVSGRLIWLFGGSEQVLMVFLSMHWQVYQRFSPLWVTFSSIIFGCLDIFTTFSHGPLWYLARLLQSLICHILMRLCGHWSQNQFQLFNYWFQSLDVHLSAVHIWVGMNSMDGHVNLDYSSSAQI